MASTLSLREFDSQRPVSRHHKDENYITNAWHSMTKAFHQISENEASGDSSHPQSFLAQQRMCAALRRIRPSQDKPMVTLAGAFPHRQDSESSGNGPDEPIRGSVRVVKLSPHFLRRAAVRSKNSPSRGAFPAFLALGRAGPSAHHKPAVLLPQVSASTGADARRKQGLEMWQKVMHKSKEAVALRINPKDMPKQSCAAAPFTQRITEDGCETVTVHNHLCFGQCSSMFVPSSGESRAQEAHCTRCGPSKSRSVLVPLRCGTEVRERRVMVVEECKCETSSDEVKVQNTERVHL